MIVTRWRAALRRTVLQALEAGHPAGDTDPEQLVSEISALTMVLLHDTRFLRDARARTGPRGVQGLHACARPAPAVQCRPMEDSPRRRSRRPPAAPKPDRKLAILLAAERLFATRGYHAVGIRQIADAAGVPQALVGYYYGHKDALFHALFARRAPQVAERTASLRALARGPVQAGQLRSIVETFVTPVLQLRASPDGEYYALLITVCLSMQQAPEADRVLREFFDPMAEAFIDALQTALAGRTPAPRRATLAWCYQFALGALLNHLCDSRVERLSHQACRAGDPAAAPLLVDFILHGIAGLVAGPAAHSPYSGG